MSFSFVPQRLQFLVPRDEQLDILLLAACVGACGAVAGLLFRFCLLGIQHLLGGDGSGMVALALSLPLWQRVALPACGGALAGMWLQYGLHWIPRKGSDDYLEAITVGDGVIGFRQTMIKITSSLCSIGSGASIGREGPMVQLTAMLGSKIGVWLNMPREKLQLLVTCGVTAGVATAYNAPIAASMFVWEITTGVLSKKILGPLIVASVIANMVARQIFGVSPVYKMPNFESIEGWEVFTYAGLGLLCGFSAPLFRYVLDLSRKTFGQLKLGLVVNMTLGGLGVGLISVWEPQVWGNGYTVVNLILHNPWTWQALATVLVLKIVATALCSGSGAVGGVFTPTIFVGAALGALYAHALVGVTPLSETTIASYAMVGMGAFLASVTYAPLMCILMIFEMTLSYQIILPLMLACVIGQYIAQRIRPYSIYDQRAEKKAILDGQR